MADAVTWRIVEPELHEGMRVYQCHCCHMRFYSTEQHLKLCPCLDDEADWEIAPSEG